MSIIARQKNLESQKIATQLSLQRGITVKVIFGEEIQR